VNRPSPGLDVDDAIQFIARYVRERVLPVPPGGRIEGSYGYEVYLRAVVAFYLTETGSVPPGARVWDVVHSVASTLSPIFAEAAWTLCRRGFLRPGPCALDTQATDEGGGFGFSVTTAGREWVTSGAAPDYIPAEPGRFARMLADRGVRFGPGFIERSQEAVRAYNALAYLACCAMCGAAAESIVLALAIAKTEDETKVMNDYAGARGRSRVEQLVIGNQDKYVQGDFHRYVDLLKYWRDSAAHGKAAGITELEAWTSLVLLLRFAIFASDRWDALTGTPQ
jgi:hypothetical protein